MNLGFMHRIDYWLGIPLCFVLSAVERLRVLFGRRPASPTRLLLIELSEMGSAVLAYPAICDAVDRLGREHVWFMIFERNREGVSVLGLIPDDHILTVSDRSFLAFASTLLNALARCRAARIDAAIDLEIFSRATALIAYLSGARTRSGLSTFGGEGLYRGHLFTHPVLYTPHHHMTRVYRALVRAAFAPPSSQQPFLKDRIEDQPFVLPRYPVSPETKRRVDDILESLRADGRIVFFNPDAGLLPLRGWPIEHFTRLGLLLTSLEPDVVVAVVGVARARPIARLILAGLPEGRGLDLTGQTQTIDELLALFERGAALVTIDSGPAHLAGLTGIARIVLFGPETPALYAPIGERVEVCYEGIPCSPCFSAANHRTSPCTDNVCLKQITPEQVLMRVRQALASGHAMGAPT